MLDMSPPSPASSESILPASSPPTRLGTPSQRQRSHSPVTYARRAGSAGDPNSPGRRRSGSARTPSKSPTPDWQLELSPTLQQRQPSQSPAPVSIKAGSDTGEEHDHVLNAYILGCADGRAEGRNDAFKLAGVEGTQETARAVAAHVLGIDLDELDALLHRTPRVSNARLRARALRYAQTNVISFPDTQCSPT